MTEQEIYRLAIEAIGSKRAADALKEDVAQMQESIRRLTERAAGFRAQVAEAMADGGFKEISGPGALLTYRNSSGGSVVITDEGALPAEFVTQPPPPAPRPDKAAIKSALKAGRDVPGASLSNGAPSVSIKEL